MMHCRTIKESDWPSILRIQQECYGEEIQETLAALQSRWHLSPNACFVAETENTLIGYALSHPWKDQDVPTLDIPLQTLSGNDLLYVHDLAVSTSGRGSGAAALLVNAVTSSAMTGNLCTMALTAIQGSTVFWETYGFQVADYHGDLKGYGDGAAYMKRTLNNVSLV